MFIFLVSGRSSAYGETAPESLNTGARSETSSVGLPSTTGLHHEGEGSDQAEAEDEAEKDGDGEVDPGHSRLHALRLLLLENLLKHLPDLRQVGGVRSIPFMQVNIYCLTF